uniref:Uncharacterized protein n=1 Tax=uncultured Methanosarcinales archaeon TaxID=183757 RepID=A0A7H1KNE2_9EURY|nr:hypothetical protein EKMJPAOO_00006 [uncultured Methanosarcinales archaeon]
MRIINKRHYHGSDRICQDDSAVSTVIGATLVLGLLIAVTAFIIVHYVPSWVADDEARHAQDVFVDFSAIPGHIDELVLANNTDAVSRQRIELGCGGIPIMSPGMSWGSLGTVPQEGNFSVVANVWTENITKNVTSDNFTDGCVNITNISSVSKFYIYIEDSSNEAVTIHLSDPGGGAILRIDSNGYDITTWHPTGVKILDELTITTPPDPLVRQVKVNILSPCYGFSKVLSDADIPYNITMMTDGNSSNIRYCIEYYEYNKTMEPYTKTSNGTMVYRSMNRYFLDQQFIYQAGAVFLCQAPNASMRTLPDITIEDVGNYTHVTIPMVTVGTGVNRTPMIGGSGVEELQMGLKYVNRITFADRNNTGSVNIIIEPPEGDEDFRRNYLQEWADYFDAAVEGTSIRMAPPPPPDGSYTNTTITLIGDIHLEIKEIEIEGRIASIAS